MSKGFHHLTLKKSTGQEVYEYNRDGKNHHPLCNDVSVLRWVGSVNESERSLNHHPSISPQTQSHNGQELYDCEHSRKDFSDSDYLYHSTHRRTENGGNSHEYNHYGKSFLILHNESFTGEREKRERG